MPETGLALAATTISILCCAVWSAPCVGQTIQTPAPAGDNPVAGQPADSRNSYFY